MGRREAGTLAFKKKMHSFLFGYAGSSSLRVLFSSCNEWGLLSGCSAQASLCGGFSCGAWAPDTQASVVVALGLSCSMACGIFPDQGSNPHLLHWQVDLQVDSHWATREALLLFSYSVVSDSLWSYELQYTRLPCPSPTPGAYSNACPLSWWCH